MKSNAAKYKIVSFKVCFKMSEMQLRRYY